MEFIGGAAEESTSCCDASTKSRQNHRHGSTRRRDLPPGLPHLQLVNGLRKVASPVRGTKSVSLLTAGYRAER